MSDGLPALTEREKQTLRLIVRGHDAKSVARHLDLSVHTINERLREARRKLAVSSSREAARLLLEQESHTPDLPGDMGIGEAKPASATAQAARPQNGRPRRARVALIATGGLMSIILALVALATPPETPATRPPASATAADSAVETAARDWLALLDEGRWAESWSATGASFRSLNTSAAWAAASERVRAPLGAARSRTLIAHDDVPAPPQGYDVLKFRTSFAKGGELIETVALDRENGSWRVVGVYVG